jgi:hypothetical protein
MDVPEYIYLNQNLNALCIFWLTDFWVLCFIGSGFGVN